jgi:hypothetical protein
MVFEDFPIFGKIARIKPAWFQKQSSVATGLLYKQVGTLRAAT